MVKIKIAKTSEWGDWEAWSKACGWTVYAGDWKIAYEAAMGHLCMCRKHK